MGVSENWGTPKSSILIWFSIINHPFWGTPILETPIYTRKFNSSPLKVIDGSYKTIRIPILLGFRPIFRGRLLLNFRGACFTQRVCVLWFPSFNPKKKLAIYSVFLARASSPWARGFSCNSSFGRNCCNTEGPSIAKDILCSRELPS